MVINNTRLEILQYFLTLCLVPPNLQNLWIPNLGLENLRPFLRNFPQFQGITGKTQRAPHEIFQLYKSCPQVFLIKDYNRVKESLGQLHRDEVAKRKEGGDRVIEEGGRKF